MAEVVVGRAALELVPQFVRDLDRRISAKLTGAARGAGQDMSRQLDKEGARGGARFVNSVSARISAGPFRAIGTRIGGSIVAGFAAVGLARMTASVSRFAVGAASNLEQVRIGFTTMLGSAQAAEKFLRQLQAFANSTPFEFADVSSAAQRLMAMGVAANDVVPYLTAIGDAVAGLGGGKELINQVTTALGQMVAKGKIQSDELLQLTEAGIPALKILADSYGVTTGKMQEMVTAGDVLASDAVPKIIAGLEKGTKTTQAFGGMMEKQSHTFAGLMSTLKDSASTALANGLQPLLHVAEKLLPPAIDLTGRAMTRASQALSDGVTNAQRFVEVAKYAGTKALWAFQAGWTDPTQAVDTGMIGLAERIGAALSTALAKVNNSGIGQAVRNLFTDVREASIGSNLAHNVIAGVKTGIDTGDWSDLGNSLGKAVTTSLNAAGNLGRDLTDSIIHLLQSVDWASAGRNLGGWLADAVGAAAGTAVKLTAAIGEQIAKVDWFGLAFQLGKQAPTLLVGLALGILNFDMGSLLHGLADHWFDVILGILALAFAPERLVTAAAKLLGRVPLAGPLLRWLFEAAVSVSKGAVSIVGKIAGDFVAGLFGAFGREVPKVGGFVSGVLSTALRYTSAAVRGWAEDFVGVIRTIPGRAGAFAGEMLKAGGALIRGLVDGFMTNIRSVDNMLGNVGSKVWYWARGAGTYLLQAGRDLIGGLFNGALEKIKDVGGWVANIGGKIIDAVKHFFGIHSPSTVFAELGGHLMAGLFKGITDNSGDVLSIIRTVFRDAVNDPMGWAVSHVGDLAGLLKKVPELAVAIAKRAPQAIMGLLGKGIDLGKDLAGALGLGGNGDQFGWAVAIKQALAMLGQPQSALAGLMRRVNFESGFRDNAVNLTDSNAQAGHPSVGGFQMIAGTWQRFAGPFANVGPFLYGVSTNKLAQAFAAIRYILATYGSLGAVDPVVRPKGYAKGGIASGWSVVGEKGPELAYFPGPTGIISNANSERLLGALANFDTSAGLKARLFDSGGILAHGSLGLNLSGQPERVLNPDETRAYEAGRRSRRGALIQADRIYIGDQVDLELLERDAEWRDRRGGF